MIEWAGSVPLFIDGMSQPSPFARAAIGAELATLLTAPLGAALVPLIDHVNHYERGAPTIVSTSMLLGLGEAIAWNEYFANRATSSFHTYRKDIAWIFAGPAVGLATGLVLTRFVKTTPGRASWVATTGLFGGLFAGSLAGAASRPAGYPTPAFDPEGNRNVGITAALAGIAGTAGGIATATWLSPSTLRVHLIDLGWIGGAVIPGLACIDHCKAPDSFAAIAIGSGIGFVSTFIATAWLPKDGAPRVPRPSDVSISPLAFPIPGGLEIGFGGSL